MKRMLLKNINEGVPFVLFPTDWVDVWIKIDGKFIVIASNVPNRKLGGLMGESMIYAYLIDIVDIPFRTQVDKPKFKVGDRVLVVGEGYEWGNVLVKDSIAIIDEVLPNGKYDVTGVVKDKTVPLSPCKQFAVEEHQLKKYDGFTARTRKT